MSCLIRKLVLGGSHIFGNTENPSVNTFPTSNGKIPEMIPLKRGCATYTFKPPVIINSSTSVTIQPSL